MSFPLYIEILIVMDKNLISYGEDFDSENYILTVFNMASRLSVNFGSFIFTLQPIY